MAEAGDAIVNDAGVVTASRPLLRQHSSGLNEGGRSGGTAIPLGPGRQPFHDTYAPPIRVFSRRKAFVHLKRVSAAVKLDDRSWVMWVTAALKLIGVAGHWREGGDASRQSTGEK